MKVNKSKVGGLKIQGSWDELTNLEQRDAEHTDRVSYNLKGAETHLSGCLPRVLPNISTILNKMQNG